MTPTDLDRAITESRRFRSILAVSTLAMVALSFPLWVDGGEFPRVPFLRGLPEVPRATFVLMIAGLAAASVGFRPRSALAVSAAATAILVAGDQHRLQPWAYHFLCGAVAYVACREIWAARLCRWYLISVYVHSGLSKLDVSHVRENGAAFLETATRLIGVSVEGWTWRAKCLAILAMPAAELAIGAGLGFASTRPFARWGAIAMHGSLIVLLGPRGLDHSTIVQVWNAAFIAQTWVLFSREATAPTPKPLARESAVAWFYVAIVVLPIVERWGWFDSWPSHALYAAHCERTAVLVPTESVDSLPISARAFAKSGGTDDAPGDYSRIDLTAWSRGVRGTPVYPQARACNGLAEYLCERYRGGRPIRVLHYRAASFWDGSRRATILDGPEAVRREAGRYWLNARFVGGR